MNPEQAVRRYLEAMERRDLAAAKALLAPGFHMVFPGGRRFDQQVWNDMGEVRRR